MSEYRCHSDTKTKIRPRLDTLLESCMHKREHKLARRVLSPLSPYVGTVEDMEMQKQRRDRER